MSFEQSTKKYLKELQPLCEQVWAAGRKSTELATRPVVHNFLCEVVKNIQPNCTVEHDTAVSGTSNRPDWIFSNPGNFGIYCYGDHKGLNPDSPYQLTVGETKQIERYLAMGRPVFVFDGIEFLFFIENIKSVERMSLIKKPLTLTEQWPSMAINSTIEAKLRDLFNVAGFRQWTERNLVTQLANRARSLSESIQEVLRIPAGAGFNSSENKLIDALHCLQTIVSDHHDPGLSDTKSCADFVSQVLIFGLFYAHTKSPKTAETPGERRSHIDGFWSTGSLTGTTSNLRPFAAVHKILSDQLTSNNNVAAWYRDVIALLSHVEYVGSTVEPTDYHSLYESFLAEFDPALRFDRGAFFTPNALATWMVRATDELVKKQFGGSIPEMADKVIDPCCGTGGYIEALLRECDFDESGESILVGFEVLPGPYALAKYRMDQVTSELGIDPSIDILLTDTLSDHLEDPQASVGNGFSQEQAQAAEYAHPPIRIVIGNPPSSDSIASAAPRTQIELLMNDFRPPQSSVSTRQNIQQALNNEAYRFLRWSSKKVLDTGVGVVSLIMPGGLATGVSFVTIRQWLLQNFDRLIVLIFDKDGRTGTTGNSLFNVLQGRLVIICVKSGSDEFSEFSTQQILFRDISEQSIREKKLFLSKESRLLDEFKEISLEADDYRFEAERKFDKELWIHSWPLSMTADSCGIFLSKCSGVKLAPTHLLFHTDINVLKRRSLEIGSKTKGQWSKTYPDLMDRWYTGQQRVPAESKFTEGVRTELFKSVKTRPENIKRYCYRPFNFGYCLQDELLYEQLSQTKGDGTRRRPEVIAAFEQGAIGICVAPSTQDLGATLNRFVTFTDVVPDNDNVARGNAMVFCDKFPENKPRRGSWDSIVRQNITSEFYEAFSKSFSSHDIVYYTYAVMNSQAYRDCFEPALFGPSNPGNPARVPLFSDHALVREIIEAGKAMADYEVFNKNAVILDDIESDWPVDLNEISLKSAKINNSGGEIKLLCDDGQTITCSCLPIKVLMLRISGHDVVKKWLRERSFKYLRRAFSRDDLHQLFQLISNIHAQQLVLHQVSNMLNSNLRLDNLIPPPAPPQE